MNHTDPLFILSSSGSRSIKVLLMTWSFSLQQLRLKRELSDDFKPLEKHAFQLVVPVFWFWTKIETSQNNDKNREGSLLMQLNYLGTNPKAKHSDRT